MRAERRRGSPGKRRQVCLKESVVAGSRKTVAVSIVVVSVILDGTGSGIGGWV